jgi:dipeptidyl aminopeptidase/acylaminoacyl peptidase
MGLHLEFFVPHDYSDLVQCHALMPGMTTEIYARHVRALAEEKDVEAARITYECDGCTVTGIQLLPTLSAREKLPLVIFNRGGNREFSILTAGAVLGWMKPLALKLRAGVLASNYRGNDGGTGRDEFGGADVRDVLTLMELGQQQPWWDGKNIFMFGVSRGGQMTYQAIRAGAPLRAAATVAGPTDLAAAANERPAMERVYAETIPQWDVRREEALTERSALCWPEALNVPLLIFHGDADDRVHVTHSRRLAERLGALQKPYRYVEYAGDDHGLWQNRAPMWEEVVGWFERYRDGSGGREGEKPDLLRAKA